MDSSRARPTVAVLLATFNGRRWLPAQLESILGQHDVDVTVHVLDDGSTDGTVEWLEEVAAREPRLTILSPETPSGSAAANFYRLLLRADVGAADFVALADQDDIWLPNKLSRHAAILSGGDAVGVSSSITSFTSSGSRTLVRKNYPQRRFDYLFESPGPGCTFLLTPKMVELAREVLRTNSEALGADFHDSLIYALARARGWSWQIDGEPSVDYRQHESNVMGSNVGSAPALARLKLIASKWHREQAALMGRVCLSVVDDGLRAELSGLVATLSGRGIRNRVRLARLASQFRRRPRDRAIIGVLIAMGVW